MSRVKPGAPVVARDTQMSPPPWLEPTLARALALPHAHALLLHGAPGDGLLACAERLVRHWLCEADAPQARPCGQCVACHLLDGGLHADLHRLLPEELRLRLGLGASGAEQGGEGAGMGTESGAGTKRKPSRQIRIDEVRAAIDWAGKTSARGRAKVVLIHPAEAMNLQAASALLKTLEEPPSGVRLLLAAAEPARLLPTVRSRCQVVRLQPPDAAAARAWLQTQGLTQADVLLAACSGRPLDALALAQGGVDAQRWASLPADILRRQPQAVAGLALPALVDVLQKLCHDGLALAAGAAPRFFPVHALPAPRAAAALAHWSRELMRLARHAEHGWHEALLVDALLAQAAAAWQGEYACIGGSDTDQLRPQEHRHPGPPIHSAA